MSNTQKEENAVIRKSLPVTVKAIGDGSEDGLMEIIINSGKPDMDNDMIDLDGMIVDNSKMPPFAAFHRYDQPAVGKFLSIWRDPQQGLKGIVKWAVNEYELARTLYQLYKGGYMTDVSIGIQPIEIEQDAASGGEIYRKWKMLEASAVLIGADPRAQAVAVKGVNLDLVKEVAEGKIAVKDYHEPAKVQETQDSIITYVSLVEKAASGIKKMIEAEKIGDHDSRELKNLANKTHELSKVVTQCGERLNAIAKDHKRQVVRHIKYVLRKEK